MPKVVVISNSENTGELMRQAQEQGYITFVYRHADPQRELALNKFMYIRSDEELLEKLALLKLDVTALDEVARW